MPRNMIHPFAFAAETDELLELIVWHEKRSEYLDDPPPRIVLKLIEVGKMAVGRQSLNQSIERYKARDRAEAEAAAQEETT